MLGACIALAVKLYVCAVSVIGRGAMAGLRKQKKYNWKETNLAYFGSELEKQVGRSKAAFFE